MFKIVLFIPESDTESMRDCQQHCEDRNDKCLQLQQENNGNNMSMINTSKIK